MIPESEISVDRRAGVVVWRMSVEVARFYADELDGLNHYDGGLGAHDDGIAEDVTNLRAAADRLDPPTTTEEHPHG